jgi:hypothetical protein
MLIYLKYEMFNPSAIVGCFFLLVGHDDQSENCSECIRSLIGWKAANKVLVLRKWIESCEQTWPTACQSEPAKLYRMRIKAAKNGAAL